MSPENSQDAEAKLIEEYQLSVKLSQQASELQQKTATLLILERGKLEAIAFNLANADFFREDALRRIALVNEALEASYKVFNTIQSQLSYLYPLATYENTCESADTTISDAPESISPELIN